MQQGIHYFDGVEWSGWPIEDAQMKTSHPHYGHAGFFYAIEFTDGWLKVGSAANARHRLAIHAKDAALRDARIRRAYVSKPHVQRHANETALIEFCSSIAAPANGREYFRGVGYERVARFADGLPQTLYSAEEMAERERGGEGLVDMTKKIWGAYRESPADTLRAHIAAFMGRNADGSYSVSSGALNMDDPLEPEDLLDMFATLAERKGVPHQEVLDRTWAEVHGEIIHEMVRAEVARLTAYCWRAGHKHMTEPIGEHIFGLIEERNAKWAAEAETSPVPD